MEYLLSDRLVRGRVPATTGEEGDARCAGEVLRGGGGAAFGTAGARLCVYTCEVQVSRRAIESGRRSERSAEKVELAD
jgi:hypothetical protein